jgi:CubicO group peptidase (beta-lactamase class C family)
MMRLVLRLSLLISLFCVTVIAEAEQFPYVPAMLTSFMQEHHVPGMAVMVFGEGKPEQYYLGNATPDQAVTKRTIFELGNVSDLLTAVLVAQQVDYAKMQLKTPITEYLIDIPKNFEKVTLQNLVTHVAGLPYSVPSQVQTREQLMAFLAQQKLKVGKTWRDSLIDTGLLGYALEVVSHKSFNQLYRGRLLGPLGMQAIALTVPAYLEKYYAQGYGRNDKPVPHQTLGILPAADGIKASAYDMQQFLTAAIGFKHTPPQVFYPMRLTQSVFLKLPNRMQGLGWNIYELSMSSIRQLLYSAQDNPGPLAVTDMPAQPLYNGNLLFDKVGSTEGFTAYIAVVPGRKSGIVVLANKALDHQAIILLARNILFKVSGIKRA